MQVLAKKYFFRINFLFYLAEVNFNGTNKKRK